MVGADFINTVALARWESVRETHENRFNGFSRLSPKPLKRLETPCDPSNTGLKPGDNEIIRSLCPVRILTSH